MNHGLGWTNDIVGMYDNPYQKGNLDRLNTFFMEKQATKEPDNNVFRSHPTQIMGKNSH